MEPDAFARVPRNLQFRVGLLLGLTIMVAAGFLAYALYARGVFEATQRLTLVADNAEGVSIGMDLTFSGFPIGRVERISLAEDGRARIAIDIPREDARWLRASSIFTLERGLVGPPRIRAFTGNLEDAPLPDGAERVVLRGDTQEEIPRMVATLRSVLENVEQVTGPGGSLQASLASLQASLDSVQALTGRLAGEVPPGKLAAAVDKGEALLASLVDISRRLDTMAQKADRRVFGEGGVAEGAARVLGEANAVLAELRASLKRVDGILADAQAVSGNTRAATEDLAGLRAEVEETLRRLSSLIEEIDRKWPFQRDSDIRLP